MRTLKHILAYIVLPLWGSVAQVFMSYGLRSGLSAVGALLGLFGLLAAGCWAVLTLEEK